jgi:hypothetical protein
MFQDNGSASFRTQTDPIDAGRRWLRSIRFDGHCEADIVKRCDSYFVQLEKRLTTRADQKKLRIRTGFSCPRLERRLR